MDEYVLSLSEDDYRHLERHGMPKEEFQRQWRLLSQPQKFVEIDRACQPGDGIVRLGDDERRRCIDLHQRAAEQKRWTKFVPASGAASRMFALSLDEEQQRFCNSLQQFAFFKAAKKQLTQQGVDVSHLAEAERNAELIDTFVKPSGLGYGTVPKALIEFHSYPRGNRTAFEEQLLEAVSCFQDSEGGIQCHLTIPADSQSDFQQRLQRLTDETDTAVFEITFSEQHASTDTVARTSGGELVRGSNGQPMLRPGGHGALIENLNELKGDLVFVKNIDNVAHGDFRGPSTEWIKVLGGYLVQVEQKVHQYLHRLENDEAGVCEAAFDFLKSTFPGAEVPNDADSASMRDALIQSLRRPIRVCGMVKNEGEPGGGPFWVTHADGNCSPQIVETAEVNRDCTDQDKVLKGATHFNPVFMALSLRDESGESYDLRRFIDPSRVIVTKKQIDGQECTVLEHPGLWNGAMAHWNSVFVEVPMDVFSPVKTVLDLLRVQHQPASKQSEAS